MIGISQPHVHYVLKGVRTLSIEIADSILNILHLSILDLASPEDLERNRRPRPSPCWKYHSSIPRLAQAFPGPARIDRRNRFPTPVPTGLVPPALVMARLPWMLRWATR